MTTRFRTRAFLICFLPFAALLALSFSMVQGLVQSAVRSELRASMGDNQRAIARIHAKGELENSRFLRVAGENAALKAGLELMLTHPGNREARSTVEDQLRELGEHMGFDLLLVSGPNGAPMAGVIRRSGKDGTNQLVPAIVAQLNSKAQLVTLDGRIFQVATVPMDQNEDNIGSLSVGEYFDFSELTTPAVLLENGKALESNIASDIASNIASNVAGISPSILLPELNTALGGCNPQAECDLRLHNARWISLPVQSYEGGFELRSLQNVDAATVGFESRLNRLFMTLALICVLLAFVSSIVASRSIEKPLATLISHLRKAGRTGTLPEFEAAPSSILEIRQLAETYNRAAVSVREAGKELEAAYLEFAGSLANALDARDRYTAGHSRRVSEISCAIAAAIGLPADDLERIRVGALLHDIGKIGIADSVLQKPGRLTPEEFEIVKQHPVIGRRIMEGVRGLAPFLASVELHHENWDGTGYPRGQRGEETPIDARIIHVADAYDAMTTDRSYRKGMTHERALAILVENADTQFDPRMVDAIINLPREMTARHAEDAPGHDAAQSAMGGAL